MTKSEDSQPVRVGSDPRRLADLVVIIVAVVVIVVVLVIIVVLVVIVAICTT